MAWNNSVQGFVVEAVGFRFFAPGTTPEMPLRAATCREAQDGHQPCEAAGHPFGAGGFVISTRASVTPCASELAQSHLGERYPPFPRQWKPPDPTTCNHPMSPESLVSQISRLPDESRRSAVSARPNLLHDHPQPLTDRLWKRAPVQPPIVHSAPSSIVLLL